MAPVLSSTLEATTTLFKRDANSPANYPAYVLAIIVGCIAFVLLGYGIWSMYHGPDEAEHKEFGAEQRQYMRQVRERTLNRFEAAAHWHDKILDSPRKVRV
ncbi:hypothetical protein POX_c03716 [Penicillium oxalicum]|uniref:hypothetical protein n=1 Tax=Penicillium oxalicum TaxID=69781 RepID=UPI0020B71995|nr:hypothetical protein POX_c03716 [Penicillium oxalicum]KAI2790865.1 hypothetical protein POX_c03716 [Penicillium oxalicum]